MTIDFQRQVLDRSRDVPVLVDFWAAWCGPCRMLGPTLEDMAREAGGRWELVKVDTEAQPELATRYGIMSIPAVKLFRDGAVVDEFVGALPRAQIEIWLERHLPDPVQDELHRILERWEAEGAGIAPDLEAFLAEHPDHPEGRLRLAQALVGSDPARAREILGEGPTAISQAELSGDVTSLADLMDWEGEVPERARPHLRAAREAFRAHDLNGVLDHLVDAAMVDHHFGDELARRAAVALFRLLGHDHPLTRDHQRRLSMALHS
jgi:putative thioredoxin